MTKKQEKELLESVKSQATEGYSFLSRAGVISALMDEYPETPTSVANYIKGQIQKEAVDYWKADGEWGFVVAATGVGKSLIAINAVIETMKSDNSNDNFLVVVPTEKLRDENWKEEFQKWGHESVWDGNVQRECYASISRLEGNTYDLVVCDEAHNLTENNIEFFKQNSVQRLLCLSATPPQDETKKALLKELNVKIVYEVDLDTAVKLRLVAPYEILIVETRLDSVDKYIPAGSKDKPFLSTELSNYTYLTNLMKKQMFSTNPQMKKAGTFTAMKRMRMIYNLKSKTEAAKVILSKISQQYRVLTFCGSIEQAESLANKPNPSDLQFPGDNTPHTFHSKSGDYWLKKFQSLEVSRLTCVKALNEGMNIPQVDYGVVVQLDSNERSIVQRIGRLIRYRKGHIGKIIIIIAVDTQDEKWANKALENLDQSKIKRVRYENIVSGSETL